MEDQENNNIINRNSPHDRKQIYRDLLNEIEKIQESNDLTLRAITKIKTIVNEANLLDSIKTGETIEQLDFVKLLDDARDIIPNVIESSFIYGTYDFTKLPEPKEKKEKLKQSQIQANKKELLEVRNTADDKENDDSVLILYKILQIEYTKNGNKPLKYYDFVIDTSSYSATIENMFYLSFLIRDGKAKLEIDENNIPIIQPTPRKELKSFRQDDGKNTQMINSIDMDEWNRLRSREGYVQKHKRSL